MKLSRESRYGLEALVHLAGRGPEAVVEAGRLAEEERLPASFVAKILATLARHGIVRSHRGRQRGYSLARPPAQIPVLEVLEAIEGPGLFDRCIFWSDGCADEAPCLLHDTWKTVKPVMASLLSHITIDELAHGQPLPTLGDVLAARREGSDDATGPPGPPV
jgi:Rrf2 family protein